MPYTILLNLLLIISALPSQEIRIKVIDKWDKPIEGVHIKCNNNFWHTNKDGIANIKEGLIHGTDSISFSHLAHSHAKLVFSSLPQSELCYLVQLEQHIRTLDEVATPIFDVRDFVEQAIKKIPTLYQNPYEADLGLNAEFSYSRTDEGYREELINYKGILQLSSEKKTKYVAKKPESEIISPNLKKNIFFRKPYHSLFILSIQAHRVIRRYKSYIFTSYEPIEYKGTNALKILFKRKGNSSCSGFLIIDKETQAILALDYTAENINNWYIGTMKGKGLVSTNAIRHHVQADYTLDETGKYIFDSGRKSLDCNTRWKKEAASTLTNVYLKRVENDTIDRSRDRELLKELFL